MVHLSDGFFGYLRSSEYTVCPLGADGKPLLIGETVYGKLSGAEYRVEGLLCNDQADKLYLSVYDHVFGRNTVRLPWQLTHEAPDSWEQLEADSKLTINEYVSNRNLDKKKWHVGQVIDDIIARAKRLAGVE